CDAYAMCEEAAAADAYICAIDEADSQIIACKVGIESVTGEQCAGREVILPGNDLTGCTWSVIGGPAQGDYLVGLRPLIARGAQPLPVLDSCDAVLQAAVVTQRPPGTWYVPLRRTSELGAAWYLVELTALVSPTCDPPDGLSCNGLSAPP